jgi:hypothetical protein
MPIQDRDWYRSESSRMTRIQAMVHRERQAALQRQARREIPMGGRRDPWRRKLDALNRRTRNLSGAVFIGVTAIWAVALALALVWLLSANRSAVSVIRGGTVSVTDPAGKCGYYINSNGQQIPSPCGNWRNDPTPPSGATARCRDGAWSWSRHPHYGGTCSYHGGVQSYR